MKINKIFTTIILIALLSVKANAFIITTLVLVTEILITEVTSVAIVGEAIMAGETATAISSAATTVGTFGARKIATKTVKELAPSKNYRKTAIENTPVKKGGWVQDPYNGKHYRVKDMDVDHIWPKKYGGTNHSFNLVLASKHTNRAKGATIDSRVIKGYIHNAKQYLSK